MFSKALFKQSCKANGVLWAVVTFALCFMLACVMLISGSGSISKLKDGLTNSIVESSIESQMESRAISYQIYLEDSLGQFDKYFVEDYNSNYLTYYQTAYTDYSSTYDAATAQSLAAQSAYAQVYSNAVSSLQTYVSGVITSQGYTTESTEGQEIMGLVFYVLNPLSAAETGTYDSFYIGLSEVAPSYDTATLMTSYDEDERASYIAEYSRVNGSIFLAGNMVSDANVSLLVAELEAYGIDAEGYASFTYEVTEGGEVTQVSKFTGTTGYTYIKNLSNTTILTFNTLVDYYTSTEGGSMSREAAVELVSADLTQTLLTTLPSDVSDSLTELGSMDLYSLIVGSIFFKMAGLLLPIIYMIMAANNLIAGQVDSGSMAYVLSTSTKRRQVTATQAVFLIGSLFLMFALSTVTGLVCLAIIKTEAITMTYLDVILLNLGAFITMFAMSGISYFASCFFNRSKYSMSVGGGLNMYFLVAAMLGLFGSKTMPSVIRMDALNFFNYTSIISLFDVDNILSGGVDFIWKLAILAVIGIVFYIAGCECFKRKDLPL